MSRKTAVLAAVAAVAACTRAVYLWQISRAPFFDLRIGDADAYHVWAQAIAAGDWRGHGVFYQAPLYPYVLAGIYRIFGEGAMTVRLVHAAIGTASCVLLSAAGMRLFGERGAIAGFLLAVYPTAIFLDGLLEKSALVTLLTATLLFLLARPIRRLDALFTGVVLGLLALTRENAVLLIVPVGLWVIAKRDQKTPDLFLGALFLAGCALVLLPVSARNYAVGGEFQLTTSQFGPNLYIGNHAGATGTYEALVRGHGSAADEQRDATMLAEQATGRRLTPGEVSRFWTTQALTFVRSQPARWLRQIARKFAMTFNAAELADTESQELYAEWSPVLRLLTPFNFGVLIGLAVFGVMLTARAWRRIWFLYALAVTYTISIVMFYVFARYRFPLVPMLMVLAAGAAAEKGAVPLFRRPLLFPAIGAAALAVAFAHLPLGNPGDARVTHVLDIANALSTDPARTDAAMEFYQRALREGPRLPPVQFGFAMFLARTGHPQEAVSHYRTALEVWPDDAQTRFNLGLALAASGQTGEGLGEMTEAVRIRPNDVEMQMAFAQVLIANGHPDLAAEHYQQALALQRNLERARQLR